MLRRRGIGLTVVGSPERLHWNHVLAEHRKLQAIWLLLVNARAVMMPHPERCAEKMLGTEDRRMLLSSVLESVRKGRSQSTAGVTPWFVVVVCRQ